MSHTGPAARETARMRLREAIERSAVADELHAADPTERLAAERAYAALLDVAYEVGDRAPRPKGCHCQWEVGDSPCPVHGDDERET